MRKLESISILTTQLYIMLSSIFTTLQLIYALIRYAANEFFTLQLTANTSVWENFVVETSFYSRNIWHEFGIQFARLALLLFTVH